MKSDLVLSDARLLRKKHPTTFSTPYPAEIAAIRPGDCVKVIVQTPKHVIAGERMWILVDKVDGEFFEGKLDNDPVAFSGKAGDRVKFEARHIIDIWTTHWEP